MAAPTKFTIQLQLTEREISTLATALELHIENLRDGFAREREGAAEDADLARGILRQLARILRQLAGGR